MSIELNGAVPEMTSRERVLAALRMEPVDRTPVCNPTSVATVELMDLVDALSSNTTARSVVELSLNLLFRREYSKRLSCQHNTRFSS